MNKSIYVIFAILFLALLFLTVADCLASDKPVKKMEAREFRDAVKPEVSKPNITVIQPLIMRGDSLYRQQLRNPLQHQQYYDPPGGGDDDDNDDDGHGGGIGGRDGGQDEFYVTIEVSEEADIIANHQPGMYFTDIPIHIVIDALHPNWWLELQMNPLVKSEDEVVGTDRIWIRRDDFNRDFVLLDEPIILARGQRMPRGGEFDMTIRVRTTAQDNPGVYQGLLEFVACLNQD